MENINLEEALMHAKILLKDYSTKHEFHEYARSYLFTTEYINRYLAQNAFNKEKALTVVGSGDHVFNLVYHDVFNIDAFDINKLNYFTFWLKFALILNLSFKEFKTLEAYISKDAFLPYFLAFLDRSKSCMPKDVYLYFGSLVYFEYSLMYKSNGLKNLYLPSFSTLFASNSYLQNEEAYNELKSKLEKLNIRFYFEDVRTIPKIVSGEYDIVLLSNVSDYLGTIDNPLTYEEFRKYINSFLPLLNENGLIINYLYGLRHKHVIQNSLVTLDDLGRDNVVRFGYGFSNEGYYRVRKIA